MVSLRTLIVFALGIVAANVSEGSTWQSGCKAGAEYTVDQAAVRNLGQTVCAVPASATDDTQIIDPRGCDNFDVSLYPDANGDGTGATALQWTLQSCPVIQTDAVVNTDTERDLSCNAIGSAMTGAGTIHGAGIPGVGLRINFAGTFAGDPVVFLKCNAP